MRASRNVRLRSVSAVGAMGLHNTGRYRLGLSHRAVEPFPVVLRGTGGPQASMPVAAEPGKARLLLLFSGPTRAALAGVIIMPLQRNAQGWEGRAGKFSFP